MFKNGKYGLFQIRIVFVLILSFYIISNFNNFFQIRSKLISNSSNYLEIKTFNEFFNTTVKNNTILIFEPNKYHHECTPGYSKYFITLGYKVDILMHKLGIDSFHLFNEIQNIRIFTFNRLKQIKRNFRNFSSIIKQYDYVLLQSTDKKKKNLYIQLDLLNLNNSIFVFHDISYADMSYSSYFDKNRIWTLGNMSEGLQVNPHYFGNINLKNKNEKIRFFMTSTAHRNYKYLIDSAKRLKQENFHFEIIITGRSKKLNSKVIPKSLDNIFIIKHKVSYIELFKDVESSDYIIIPLDPKSKNDIQYKTIKVTGSIQLMYGFLKPVIIHEEFASFYNLNYENSLIYDNSDLYNVIRKAILMNNKDYQKLQENLVISEKEISQISINNIKKIIREL